MHETYSSYKRHYLYPINLGVKKYFWEYLYFISTHYHGGAVRYATYKQRTFSNECPLL